MIVLVVAFILIISVGLGMAFKIYLKIARSAQYVLDAWLVLVQLALTKVHLLLSLQELAIQHTSLLKEENFLNQCLKLTKKTFLKNNFELLSTFAEIEKNTFQLLQELVTKIQSNDCNINQLQYYLEIFWAKNNLLAFAETHYNNAVERYSHRCSHPLLKIFAILFGFSPIQTVSLF